jgi:hypothetical protein
LLRALLRCRHTLEVVPHVLALQLLQRPTLVLALRVQCLCSCTSLFATRVGITQEEISRSPTRSKSICQVDTQLLRLTRRARCLPCAPCTQTPTMEAVTVAAVAVVVAAAAAVVVAMVEEGVVMVMMPRPRSRSLPHAACPCSPRRRANACGKAIFTARAWTLSASPRQEMPSLPQRETVPFALCDQAMVRSWLPAAAEGGTRCSQ